MKRFLPLAALLFLVLVAGTSGAQGQVLIDDFSTGPDVLILQSGVISKTQTGAMLGHSRLTNLLINKAVESNPFHQFGTAEILAGGPLVVSADYKVFSRLEIAYGAKSPLNQNFLASTACGSGPCGRLRVSFDGIDHMLNFNILVYTNGSYRQLGFNLLASPVPFDVDFPFSKFRSGGASFNKIDKIVLILQPGNAIGSNDYAITRIEALP